MRVGWRYESARHSLAAKGITTRRYNFGRRIREKDFQPGSKMGWDTHIEFSNGPFPYPDQSLVHGTSQDRAVKILESKMAKDGTWVPASRGGVETAMTWAQGMERGGYRKPVVVVALPKEPVRSKGDEYSWVTFGRRARERKGADITYPSAELENVRVFRIPKKEGDNWYEVDLQEVNEGELHNPHLQGVGTARGLPENWFAKKVDLKRYAGTWKQESVKNEPWFQKGLTDVTATYKPRKDGKIIVINKGYKDGKLKVAKGVARSVSSDNRKLKVSFAPFGLFEGDYKIKKLSPDYKRAVIQGGKTTWVLTR